MAWSPAKLQTHLATGALKPVYLLAGAEHLLALEAADALRAKARALGYAEREVLEAGESSFEWNALALAGASLSLFAARRVIDLRVPSGRPGKEGSEAIIAFCKNPPPDTVLLITTSTWSKAHQTAWADTVGSAGACVVFWPVKREELPAWVSQRAAARGLALTRKAVEVLIERTEGNLLAAAQEIDKLALLATDVHGRTSGSALPAVVAGGRMPGATDGKLDAAALDALVADSARFDVFNLVDSALGGETERALRIVDTLRAEGGQVPGLVHWLATQLQVMVRMAAAVQSGQNVGGVLKGEHLWGARETAYRRALERGGITFWEARLAHLARVEKMGKGRLVGDPWRELARLVAAIADARIARAV